MHTGAKVAIQPDGFWFSQASSHSPNTGAMVIAGILPRVQDKAEGQNPKIITFDSNSLVVQLPNFECFPPTLITLHNHHRPAHALCALLTLPQAVLMTSLVPVIPLVRNDSGRLTKD